jgi:hypothetical protein
MISCVFDPVITRLADEIKLKQSQNMDTDASEMEDIPYRTLKVMYNTECTGTNRSFVR